VHVTLRVTFRERGGGVWRADRWCTLGLNLPTRRNKKGVSHQAMKTRFNIFQMIPLRKRKKMRVKNTA